MMFVNFQDMIDSLAHPPIRHAAMVHLPIAFAALGLLLLLLLLLTGGRAGVLRWSTVALFLLAAGLAYLTSITGKMAEDHLALGVTERFYDPLEAHERLGEWAWAWLAGTGILVALTAMPGLPARLGFLVLAVLGSIACCGWLAFTAHHGGQLVYVHGVGVGTVSQAPAVEESGGGADDDFPVIELPVEGTKGAVASEERATELNTVPHDVVVPPSITNNE